MSASSQLITLKGKTLLHQSQPSLPQATLQGPLTLAQNTQDGNIAEASQVWDIESGSTLITGGQGLNANIMSTISMKTLKASVETSQSLTKDKESEMLLQKPSLVMHGDQVQAVPNDQVKSDDTLLSKKVNDSTQGATYIANPLINNNQSLLSLKEGISSNNTNNNNNAQNQSKIGVIVQSQSANKGSEKLFSKNESLNQSSVDHTPSKLLLQVNHHGHSQNLNNQSKNMTTGSYQPQTSDNISKDQVQMQKNVSQQMHQQQRGSNSINSNSQSTTKTYGQKNSTFSSGGSSIQHHQQHSAVYGSGKAVFSHQSKFFTLDTQLWWQQQQSLNHQQQQQQQQHLNAAQKRRRNNLQQGVISYPNMLSQQRIPDIVEWFSSLSLDDRVLCSTIVDSFLAASVQRMQRKISKYGQGMFRLQSKIEIRERNPNQAPDPDNHQPPQYYLKQDFAFTSIKAFLRQYKDQIVHQSKQIPEKELLDYVRMTYTQTHNTAFNLSRDLPQDSKFHLKVNTITVAPSLLEHPQKFVQLIRSIVGSNFLKIPYDITWDDQNGMFQTQMPVWFNPAENNSLATWVIFYLEISLWVHYEAYVRNGFKAEGGFNENLNKHIFIPKDNQCINLKNELTIFWQNICQEAQAQGSQSKIIQEIGQEIFQRSLKETYSLSEVNQLNGGLWATDYTTRRDQLYSDNKIMEVLLKNQEPHKFIQELCMINLSNGSPDHSFLLHRIFVDILRERMRKSKVTTSLNSSVLVKDDPSSANSNNTQGLSKNQKKKNKKKQKQALMKKPQNQESDKFSTINQKSQENSNIKDTSSIEQSKEQIEGKNEKEESIQEPQKQEFKKVTKAETSSDDEEEEGEEELKEADFFSNEFIIKQKKKSWDDSAMSGVSSTPVTRNSKAIDELLSELLGEEKSEEKPKEIIKPKRGNEKLLPQRFPFFEFVTQEASFTEEHEMIPQNPINPNEDYDLQFDESKTQELTTLLSQAQILQTANQNPVDNDVVSSAESTDDQQESNCQTTSTSTAAKQEEGKNESVDWQDFDKMQAIIEQSRKYPEPSDKKFQDLKLKQYDHQFSKTSNTYNGNDKMQKKKPYGSKGGKRGAYSHFGHQNNEDNDNASQNSSIQIPNFQIIRSSKTSNNANHNTQSHQSYSSYGQNNQNRKKKNKKRHGGGIKQGESQQTAASKMNTFMRNMLAHNNDYDYEQDETNNNNDELQYEASERADNETISNGMSQDKANEQSSSYLSLGGNPRRSNKKESLKAEPVVKQIYVKKGTTTTATASQNATILQQQQQKQDEEIKEGSVQSQSLQAQLQQPLLDKKQSVPVVSQQSFTQSRFENFINNKDSSDTPLSFTTKQKSTQESNSYGAGKDKKGGSYMRNISGGIGNNNGINSKSSNNNNNSSSSTLGNKKKNSFWNTKPSQVNNSNNNNSQQNSKKNGGGNQNDSTMYRMNSKSSKQQSLSMHQGINSYNLQQSQDMNMLYGSNQMQFLGNLPHGQYDPQYMMGPQADLSFNLFNNLDNINAIQQLIQQALISSQLQSYSEDKNAYYYPNHQTNQHQQPGNLNPSASSSVDPSASNPHQQYDQMMDEQALEDYEKSEAYYELLDQQMQKMVKEIERKLDSVRKERQTAIDIIESIVKETYNQQMNHSNGNGNSQFVGVRMYGSMASGLAIEQSDVDLAVVGLDFNGSRELQIQEMRRLFDQIELFMKSKSSLRFIDSATVPVIKLQVDLQKISKIIEKKKGGSYQNEIEDTMRYLGIDITFEDTSRQQFYSIESISRINQGIQCISYIQELCMKYPDLKPIVLVLKKLLQTHNLNQPYLGGINSYSLVLMTSAFLKKFSEVTSKSKNLREFLNYFGSFFDPGSIIIKDQNLIKVMSSPLNNDPMTVIDPLNELNNTTRSAFRIKDIQEIFKQAFQQIINCHSLYMKSGDNFLIDVIQRLTTGSAQGQESPDGSDSNNNALSL